MIFDLFHFRTFPCFLNVGVNWSISDCYFHFLPSTDRITYLPSGAKIVWPIPDLINYLSTDRSPLVCRPASWRSQVYLSVEIRSRRGAGGRVSGQLREPSATVYTER